MNRSITFLSVPYSHPSRKVRIARFHAANRAAAALMRCGHIVFSPISMGHPIAEAGKVPSDWNYWQTTCRAFLEASRELVILRLPGWEQSMGVAGELHIARELDIRVSYIDPTPSAATEAA